MGPIYSVMWDDWGGGDRENNPAANNKIKKQGGRGLWRWRSRRRWLNNLYISCYSYFSTGGASSFFLLFLWATEASSPHERLFVWLRYPLSCPFGWCRTQSVAAVVDGRLLFDPGIRWQRRLSTRAHSVSSLGVRSACTESTFQKEHLCCVNS